MPNLHPPSNGSSVSRSLIACAMASPVPRAGTPEADCCTYAGTLLRELRRRTGGPKESPTWWARVNVRDPLAIWSFPPAAAEVLTWQEVPVGMGASSGGTKGIPLGWYALQGWRGIAGPVGPGDTEDRVVPGSSGHSFLLQVTGHDSEGRPFGVILDSSRAGGPKYGGRSFKDASELAAIRPEARPVDSLLARWPDVLGVYLGCE